MILHFFYFLSFANLCIFYYLHRLARLLEEIMSDDKENKVIVESKWFKWSTLSVNDKKVTIFLDFFLTY